MIKGQPNYWNLYAKKEHNHDEYLRRDEQIHDNNMYGVPLVKGDGVMEIGQYIDFHSFESGKPYNDYDVRVMSSNPNNEPKGWGNIHVTCREATLGNGVHVFRMGYDLASDDIGISGNKHNAVLGSRSSVWLKANTYFDGANDIHYDRNYGAGEILVDKSEFPRYRRSFNADQQWGIANWSPWYNMLTDHPGQQVVMPRETVIGDWYDWNNAVDGGTYLVSINNWGGNAPPNSYGWGLLVVFSHQHHGVITQMYFPHSDVHNMSYRVRWGDNSWRPWKQPSNFYNATTLDEKQDVISELEARISTLENNAKSSYNKKRKRKYIK